MSQLASLADCEFHGMSEPQAARVAGELELAERQLNAAKARAAAAIEADGLWATSGARSVTAWWRAKTGRRASSARVTVRAARTLRDDLPAAREALQLGQLGIDHIEILRRYTTTTAALRTQLQDETLGEQFLIEQAGRMDADSFGQVVKAWAIRADPEAADRRWRDEGTKEELFCSPVLDGYAINGWLNVEHGKAVDAALRAVIGVPSTKDDRSPATRRAGALVHLARRALDSGELQPGARQRPHLGVQVDYPTLEALIAANEPSGVRQVDRTPTGEAPTGPQVAAPPLRNNRDPEQQQSKKPLQPIDSREPFATATGLAEKGRVGPDALSKDLTTEPTSRALEAGSITEIDPALDYQRLSDAPPATWHDGSPIAPGQLAKLACSGAVHRVIFGPAGQVLDSGREERLFTPAQTRAIIARDRCCQFPDCDAPPGEGEIHHSIWWYAQGGRTAVSDGVLLCWAHHDFVHQHRVVIRARQGSGWQFFHEDGRVMADSPPPGTAAAAPRSP